MVPPCACPRDTRWSGLLAAALLTGCATAPPVAGPLATAAAAAAAGGVCLGDPASKGSKGRLPALGAVAEVRGTWLTTTANDALASPEQTARTMRRLREIGLNTVYIEAWKDGYTQFPSEVLKRTLGMRMRPPGSAKGAAESDPLVRPPTRDLLQEATLQAHRNGLLAIAWFEYGFMAAHKDTMNHLRRIKPEWLSRDRSGSEVAPNGFVWMNPLHPLARAFLLDLVLEAVDRYDLDGVQIDDRIVWPHVSMGYDDTTRAAYAAEHEGAAPPDDFKDPAWMQWRSAKVDEFARWFVQEVRARRPGLVVSLSPAVYPWSWQNHLLDWPRWTAWSDAHRLPGAPVRNAVAQSTLPQWDEFIPQAYRFDHPTFERTWLQQTRAVQDAGAYRARRLVAGIRIVGDGADSSWLQLRDGIALTRRLGQGGHVLWFSRGVLDVHPNARQALYAAHGAAHSPRFPAGWRPLPVAMQPASGAGVWQAAAVPAGLWRVIGLEDGNWRELQTLEQTRCGPLHLVVSATLQAVELLLDRRADMAEIPACRIQDRC
jgi:uncharacterized lipoprotein YddW (UPF0748 family)